MNGNGNKIIDLVIKSNIDTSSFSEAYSELDKLKNEANDNIIEESKKTLSAIDAGIEEYSKLTTLLKNLESRGIKKDSDIYKDISNKAEDWREALFNSTGNEAYLSSSQKEGKDAYTGLINGIKQKIYRGIEEIGRNIKDKIESLYDNAISLIDKASRYSDSSKLYNSDITSLKWNYGLNSSQAYAYSKANSITGVGGMEDLWKLTSEQREFYSQMFDRYLNQYESWQENGFLQDFQNFQIEWSLFKENLEVEVVEFFMNNKDNIKSLLTSLMQFLESSLPILNGILQIITSLTNWFFSKSSLSPSSTDVISQWTNSNINNTQQHVNVENKVSLTNSNIGDIVNESASSLFNALVMQFRG